MGHRKDSRRWQALRCGQRFPADSALRSALVAGCLSELLRDVLQIAHPGGLCGSAEPAQLLPGPQLPDGRQETALSSGVYGQSISGRIALTLVCDGDAPQK